MNEDLVRFWKSRQQKVMHIFSDEMTLDDAKVYAGGRHFVSTAIIGGRQRWKFCFLAPPKPKRLKPYVGSKEWWNAED